MTPWYLGIADFLGGVFLANGIPHFVWGIAGRRLQTPFASPPFKGLSSPMVNVAWGLFNFAVAYLLLQVGEFDVGAWPQVACSFAGFGAMAFQCARAFGRLRSSGDSGSPSVGGS